MFRPSQIPILEVVEACWLQTKKKWNNEHWIYENWELTSWRSIATDRGHVTDFTHDRAEWWPFSFVKSYYWFDDHQTYKWLSENFPTYAPADQKNIMDVRKWLWDCTDQQKEYLKSRWISHELVKRYVRDYRWIACIVSKDWTPNWINSRTLESDHAKRFTSVSWYSTSWVYQGMIDKKKWYIIVVEWLIDFLTVAQYDSNVIGLKSAQDWWREVRNYAKYMDCYIVFDNDKIWQESRKNMEWLQYYEFVREQSYGEAKDFNDVYMKFWLWKDMVDNLKSLCSLVKPKTYDLKQKRTYTRWVPEMDELFWKVADKDLVVVTAWTNQWKTTFINFLANSNWMSGKNVTYFTLELRAIEIKQRYAFVRVWLNKNQFNEWDYTEEQKNKMLKIIDQYEDNFKLYDFDEYPDIDTLCKLIEDLHKNKWQTMFIIDNLWNIKSNKSELDTQSDITSRLQQLKNKHDICIILIHHNNKFKKKESIQDHSLANMRWNQKIADNSNIVIELSRDYDDVTNQSTTKISQHKDTQWWVNKTVLLEYRRGEFLFLNEERDEW